LFFFFFFSFFVGLVGGGVLCWFGLRLFFFSFSFFFLGLGWWFFGLSGGFRFSSSSRFHLPNMLTCSIEIVVPYSSRC